MNRDDQIDMLARALDGLRWRTDGRPIPGEPSPYKVAVCIVDAIIRAIAELRETPE